MIGLRTIWRAYKLKRAVKRLKRAKENSLRIHHGKKPRYPCHEELWLCFLVCLKNIFCKTLCPCCLHPHMRKDDEMYEGNFFRRLCQAGSFENLTLRSFLGFLFGVLLTACLFFFLLYQLNCSPVTTTVICCFLGIILTHGLAFNPEVRCIVFLSLPSLFSSRGRSVLIAYTFILVMSGPAKNALRNANVLVNTLNCGQEIISKQAKAIMKSIFAPLIAIVDVMRDILKALKEFARMMKEAFIAIRDLFLEIINAIKAVFQWLESITDVCSSKYGSPYKRCIKSFEDAIADCEQKMGIFKYLCYIVSALKFVCEIAKIVDLLCIIPEAIKTGIIEPLKEQFKIFARQMYNEFYVNVTFIHYYNYSLEQSKSFQEIRADIQEEIKSRMDWFTAFIDWTNLGMALFFFVLLFKAYVYRFRYLKADHFDNVYITFHVRDIDERRAAMEKETILPLTARERKKYVNTFSLRMVASERKKITVAGSLLLMSALHAGIVMLLDYSLHELLKMMNFYGHLEAKTQLPTVIQIQVKGDGVMADMYRQMVTQFDPLMKSTPDFDFSTCLPNPVPLDLDKYQRIGILFGICLLLAITESYGLRLRHVVCSCYYPEREKLRAVWLYNHILRTRGGLKLFLRRAIRRKVHGDDTMEKISILDRLAGQSRLFAKILKALGRNKIHCVSCNEPGKEEDQDNFKECGNPGCKGLYCLPCYKDLGNKCTLCLKPVDYGDLSDVSEEKDSSEEDNKWSSDEDDYEYQQEQSWKAYESGEENNYWNRDYYNYQFTQMTQTSDSEEEASECMYRRRRKLASIYDLRDEYEKV